MVSRIGTLEGSLQKIISQNLGVLAGVHGSLVSASQKKDVCSLLVTSCNRREGKTVSAVSMAFALANKANADVLLVDGNFDSPEIHRLFNVELEPGFTDLLASKPDEREDFQDVLRRTEDERLVVLPHGATITSLLDVYRSDAFEQTFDLLKKRFDFVIYDGPSILDSSDASVVAKYFDGIVLVVECERTRWEVVQLAKERIKNAGGNILGVALNKRRYYIPRAFYSGG